MLKAKATQEAKSFGVSDGVFVTTYNSIPRHDLEMGAEPVRINHGRHWKKWELPVAVLRLERRGSK